MLGIAETVHEVGAEAFNGYHHDIGHFGDSGIGDVTVNTAAVFQVLAAGFLEQCAELVEVIVFIFHQVILIIGQFIIQEGRYKGIYPCFGEFLRIPVFAFFCPGIADQEYME